ncbi:hypothetical protein [Phytoactinopolyspora halotolerans]|uniref:Uncharacterized protein n=1 Tax=Phytoactinopolyspora halotolerans TaxID=1981512 RepID=A0A6L9SE51_9ACTN|nr:hypothetical protein [Phytoactinopolyspora halotolerans]NEE02792.1 hypothetical protein [Phytoactinopolyspora halotolerans]
MLNAVRRSSRDALPGALLACALTLTLLGATPISSAEVAPGCGLDGCPPPDDDGGGSDADAEDGRVSVEVWGSGTDGGDDGRFTIPRETVWVLPACRYIPGLTGKDYYEMIDSGDLDRWSDPHTGEVYEPYEDYETYKDDDEGRWWYGACFSADFDGDVHEFFDHSERFFTDYDGAVFVEMNEEPPVPPVPPEALVDVAFDHMQLPDPEISWNPKRSGDGATLVNVETWVWMEGGPVQVEVNAAAGGNTVLARAELRSMGFSAPSAEPIICEGTGTRWSPDAESECILIFGRSSANRPGLTTPVTAESFWTVDWFANGEPQDPLDPQTTHAVVLIPVAETQTRVTVETKRR